MEMSNPKVSGSQEQRSGDNQANLTVSDPGRSPWIRCLMQVLWPAFIGAGVTVGLLFSLIDPLQISWVQLYLNESREASYTLGFLLFWVLFALACGMTWYLASTQAHTGKTGRAHRK